MGEIEIRNFTKKVGGGELKTARKGLEGAKNISNIQGVSLDEL